MLFLISSVSFFFVMFLLRCFVFIRQVQSLKEKLEKSRLEAISDAEQMIADLNRRHERDKQILMEDNKKLSSNVEFVSFCFVCSFPFSVFPFLF